MTQNGTVESVARAAWRELSADFLDLSYQQLWPYGTVLAERHGAQCEHVALRWDGELIGLASVRIRRTPFLGSGIAYVSAGPLTRRGTPDDLAGLARAIELLTSRYVQEQGLVLRILGPIGPEPWMAHARAIFEEAGFVATPHARAYRTLLLDLDKSAEALRADCSKYWRRNLRRGERRSLRIRSGTAGDLFEPICALHDRTLERKQFTVRLDARFYADLQRALTPDEKLAASIVESNGEPVAGLIAAMHGETCVPLILATDPGGLRSYAAYVLQWHSIITARERGLRLYDLGGIDPVANESVYNFKSGLRGRDVHAPGPYERRPTSVRSLLTHHAARAYRRFGRAA